MDKVFKTWKKATYFKGAFKLRDRDKNWASPIDFPTVFVAYGAGVHSGNWRSLTSINTPEYVITHYFDTVGNNIHDEMFQLWDVCKKLSKVTWDTVEDIPEYVNNLITIANGELYKLKTLN